MGEKLLIRVLLPATLQTCEFKVPLDLTVEQGAMLVARLFAGRSPEAYVATDEVDLMYAEGPNAGCLIAPTETFRSLVLQDGLRAGSSVVLM